MSTGAVTIAGIYPVWIENQTIHATRARAHANTHRHTMTYLQISPMLYSPSQLDSSLVFVKIILRGVSGSTPLVRIQCPMLTAIVGPSDNRPSPNCPSLGPHEFGHWLQIERPSKALSSKNESETLPVSRECPASPGLSREFFISPGLSRGCPGSPGLSRGRPGGPPCCNTGGRESA